MNNMHPVNSGIINGSFKKTVFLLKPSYVVLFNKGKKIIPLYEFTMKYECV